MVAAVVVFQYYSQDLPDYEHLKDYQPPIVTRIYADDGRMMATIAAENRVFVPISAIPPLVIDAFLAAEDQNFYSHAGLDMTGIVRAVLVNLQNLGNTRRPVGASTITQQVAKNMLLSGEVSYERKIREAILASRLEHVLTKDRILELYLNEIFLGNRSYGVAAAALNYFNKSLDELTLAQAAYLAALPKAPSNYHPVHDHDAALARRNWVIARMLEDKRITQEQADAAMAEPLVMRARDAAEIVEGGAYFAEDVRRQLVLDYGEKLVLEGGLAVKTSLDPRLQAMATRALREGLIAYDRRVRGWRGPVTKLSSLQDWRSQLVNIAHPAGGEDWLLAVVIKISAKDAIIGLVDGQGGLIPLEQMRWARREYDKDQFGPAVSKPSDVVKVGDVVLVEPVDKDQDGKAYAPRTFGLRQVPAVQGAIVVMDPHTGRVFAMTGGFSSQTSQYNRASQAWRQPGSAFKPFVYITALEKGFTPSSLVMDAPFEYVQGPGMPMWRPENYSQTFYGPTPLRQGIEKSRNVMTVRLANAIGMDSVVETATRFGVVDQMPSLLSFALGAKETTPLRMAAAYSIIVNGGKKVTPSVIDRVQDRNGTTIWRADVRACEGCEAPTFLPGMQAPDIPDTRPEVGDPRIVYQMTSMLEGVAQRGTAARLNALGFPVAGKTGTTNESRDAWFVGFTPDLVVAVYVGFDDPRTLGRRETGSSVALPIFQSFMAQAMTDKPGVPFRMPEGIRLVKVDAATGALAAPSAAGAIWEAFIPGTEPREGEVMTVLDGSITGEYAQGVNAAPTTDGENGSPSVPATEGTGGLY